MSTSVDQQRMKGQANQVSNGPKDEEFDSWRTQTHQNYGSQPMSSSSMAADPYMSSYYPSMTFPYLNQGGLGGTAAAGHGEGATAWSNGDPITFLGGYNTAGQMGASDHHHQAAPAHHYMDGMFGQNSFGGTTPYNQFNFFPPPGSNGGDYSTWGTSPMSSSTRKSGMNHGYHDDYYHRDPIGSSMYDHHVGVDRGMAGSLKHMEQGMGQLSISSDHGPSVQSSVVDSKDLKSGMGNGSQSIIDHHLSNSSNVSGGKKMNSPGNESLSQSNSSGMSSGGSSAPKKMSWASVASQPAKPQPKIKAKSIPPAPMLPGKPNMDIGTWDMKNGCGPGMNPLQPGKISIANSNAQPPPVQNRQTWTPSRNGNVGRGNRNYMNAQNNSSDQQVVQQSNGSFSTHPVLEKLRSDNNYNPKEYDPSPKNARFFIIKSYSEDDIHRSIKYSIWCSTEHGNKRLDAAFKERENKGPIFLFYSVNGSGHFCGMAQMMSSVDYNSSAGVWAQDKWKGQIKVKWIFVKDVPNSQLRHIRLENNENKPVTNSRDTQEVPYEKGKQVLRILIQYKHSTSIFDDFGHYEKRQEEDDARKTQVEQN